MTWPVAELGQIGRLRAVAAAFPNAWVADAVLDRPMDDVWAWVTDFERTTPQFDGHVRKVRIRRHTSTGVRMWVWTRWNPIPFPFDVTIEPGFCLMRAAFRGFLVLMAAEADGEGRTRYAHAEAVPLPGTRWLRRRIRREVNGDVQRLRRALGS